MDGLGKTYNCSHVRNHSIRWDFAVVFQEFAGYGINAGQCGVVPGFFSNQKRVFGERKRVDIREESQRMDPTKERLCYFLSVYFPAGVVV